MLTIFLVAFAYILIGFCFAIINKEEFYDDEIGLIVIVFIWPIVGIVVLVLAFMAIIKMIINLCLKAVSKFTNIKMR